MAGSRRRIAILSSNAATAAMTMSWASLTAAHVGRVGLPGDGVQVDQPDPGDRRAGRRNVGVQREIDDRQRSVPAGHRAGQHVRVSVPVEVPLQVTTRSTAPARGGEIAGSDGDGAVPIGESAGPTARGEHREPAAAAGPQFRGHHPRVRAGADDERGRAVQRDRTGGEIEGDRRDGTAGGPETGVGGDLLCGVRAADWNNRLIAGDAVPADCASRRARAICPPISASPTTMESNPDATVNRCATTGAPTRTFSCR